MLHLPELLQSVPLTPWQATVKTCLHQRLLNSWASLDQSLMELLLLSLGSWCAQGFFCALLRVSVSPVLWKFCDQILLTFKFKFPEGSQSIC